MSRRRRLSPEEEKLWKSFTETTVPLVGRDKAASTLKPQPAKKPPTNFQPKPFRIGQNATAAAPIASRSSQPVQMDQKAFGRLKRGKSKPDAKIDLHGMTADVAHAELTKFLLRAHDSGKRLVLVVTGKGKAIYDDGPIPRRAGILRQQVPLWLERPPLSLIVLQATEAHQRHGGLGAFYVYLKRRR